MGFALKKLSKAKLTQMNHATHVARERNIHKTLEHRSIVSMIGSFEDEQHVFFVLELAPGGDLHARLRAVGKLQGEVARFYAAQVVCALEYCHGRGIVYRDTKPENVLLCDNGYVKLADFGWAKRLGTHGLTCTLCGTPEYTAPEMIRLQPYGKEVDWWAIGILIFEMLAGRAPFRGSDIRSIYQSILDGKIDFSAIPDQHVRQVGNAVELVQKLLTASPVERMAGKANVVVGSPVNLVQQFLSVGPIERMTARATGAFSFRQAEWFADFHWDALSQNSLPAPYLPRRRKSGS